MDRGWVGGSKRTGGEDEIDGSVLSVFGQVIENETRKGMGEWDGPGRTILSPRSLRTSARGSWFSVRCFFR